ncbi:MAG: DUF934 domain-containing protein [Rubrivivax sp.]
MLILDPDTPLPAGALVWPNTTDVTAHADALAAAPAVVLEFPKWTDGRAYSQAVVLRGRLRFAGEIVARGEVVRDMLPLLRRCGFDAVLLADGEDRAAALRAASELPAPFPSHYQGDARQPLPRFARAGRGGSFAPAPGTPR